MQLNFLSTSGATTRMNGNRKFFTTATSLTVPAGYLSLGEPRLATITAFVEPAYSLGAPLRHGIAVSTAAVLTNKFTP